MCIVIFSPTPWQTGTQPGPATCHPTPCPHALPRVCPCLPLVPQLCHQPRLHHQSNHSRCSQGTRVIYLPASPACCALVAVAPCSRCRILSGARRPGAGGRFLPLSGSWVSQQRFVLGRPRCLLGCTGCWLAGFPLRFLCRPRDIKTSSKAQSGGVEGGSAENHPRVLVTRMEVAALLSKRGAVGSGGLWAGKCRLHHPGPSPGRGPVLLGDPGTAQRDTPRPHSPPGRRAGDTRGSPALLLPNLSPAPTARPGPPPLHRDCGCSPARGTWPKPARATGPTVHIDSIEGRARDVPPG